MKIVNKAKFLRTVITLGTIIFALIIFSNKTYSKGEISYKEDYIYSGDTLWSIAEYELKNNKYFENKDIRDVISEIKSLNNLKNTDLVEGQKILIPAY